MKANRITAAEAFLAVLALILIGVSFFQTWKGLQQIFGTASMPIAFVLSSLLLLICWLLRAARLKGQPTGGLMGMYVFIALFCFMANFNALYTRFMRTDIYTTELRRVNDAYNTLESNVEPKLAYKYPKEVAQNIEVKKRQLMVQIQDKGNPGIGTRAKELIVDLEKLLHNKVDILSPVKGDYADLAERMGQQIDNMVMDLSPSEKELKTDLHAAVVKWNQKVQDILLLPQAEQDVVAQGVIEESVAEYNKLGNRANTTLGEDRLKFKPITSGTQDIGKIGYAFSHAWQNFGLHPTRFFVAHYHPAHYQTR
jgi:hypothetical protein